MDRTDIVKARKRQKFSITAEGFLGLLIVFILIVLYFIAGGTSGFFSLQNIMALMGIFSYIFIAAIGMTMIIITGNIDISFGAVVSVIAIVMASISRISVHIPIWLFLSAGMVVGALLCGTNAYLMTKFKIPSLVVTLATMQIYYGALMWFVEGSIYNLRSNWTWFSFDAIIGGIVPLYVIIAIVLLIISILFFRYSKFIKRLYAIGNNKQGAIYAGINVEKTMVIAYIISGVLLAVSTAILATSGTRVTAMIGNNLEMKIIAAVIVGGTNAMGGSGKIYGSALGSLLLTIISPALVFLNINTYWTNMFTGLIIVMAVIVSALRNYNTSMKMTTKKEGK
jgi:ribose/xylose/arabinose/galactoside ABC-type transport system permease subunit